MVREIRTPGLGNRLGSIFKQIPPITSLKMQELLAPLCLKVSVVSSQNKASTAYHQRISDYEMWSDGYAAGSGRETVIFGACFLAEVDMSMGQMKQEKKQVVCIVHDLEEFISELRKIAVVAAVQVS